MSVILGHFFDHFPPCRNSLAGCSLAFRQDICLNGHRRLPLLNFSPNEVFHPPKELAEFPSVT